MRFISVSDFRYASLTRRLLLSLENSGNSYSLTIFCDDSNLFEPFRRLSRCEVRELPEIRLLGAKRAKFTAYRQALVEFGNFVYLDSDIIVLASLDDLGAGSKLKGAPDDLSACTFIEDPRHPWPGDPSLVNDCYVNSGVLFVPAELSDFFEHLRELSLSDGCWQRYIFPGKLYDNHFLCAHLNIEKIPVHPLDARQYNWPGFLRNGELQVLRRGDDLVNKDTGEPLKLAHFAGINDVDAALCFLPVDVASLLCERSAENVGTPGHNFTDFQASLSPYFRGALRDDFLKTAYERMRFELLTLADGGWTRDYERRATYFADPESMLSLAYSRPNSSVLWNGLQCGGAYLEGDEYNYLAKLVESAGFRTAVETGAGETSICLREKGVDSVALEAAQGPWLERAQAAGCRAIHVPFFDDRHEYDPEALEGALRDIPKEIDLIFIDSPVGTRNRSRVLTQLLHMLRPRFVLFHDAHRDSENLYRYQLEHELRVVDYLPSRRGMVLFSLGGQAIKPVPQPPDDDVILDARWVIDIHGVPQSVVAGGEFTLKVAVANRGRQILSSRYRNPVHVSYHWLTDDGRTVVHDGLRTALPFDLYPGDSAMFSVQALAPSSTGRCQLQVALVQEMVRWFDTGEKGLSCFRGVIIEPHRNVQ